MKKKQARKMLRLLVEIRDLLRRPKRTGWLEEVDEPVRKIADMLHDSDVMMDDYPAIQSFINEQLPFEVEARERGRKRVPDTLDWIARQARKPR